MAMTTTSQTQALPVGLSRSGPGIFDHEKLGKALLLRIVSTLSGLVARFDRRDGRLHEDVLEYGI